MFSISKTTNSQELATIESILSQETTLQEATKAIESYRLHPTDDRFELFKLERAMRSFIKDLKHEDLEIFHEVQIKFFSILREEHNKNQDPNKISDWEQTAILLLIDGDKTQPEKEFIKSFFQHAFGNKELIQRIKNDSILSLLANDVIQYYELTLVAKKIATISKTAESFLNGKKIAKPLQLKDIGPLLLIHHLMNDYDLESAVPELEKEKHLIIANAYRIATNLLKRIEQEAQNTYKPGDLLFVNSHKSKELYAPASAGSIFEKGTNWLYDRMVGKYDHAKIFSSSLPELTYSYIWYRHHNTSYEPEIALNSTVIRISPEKLLNSKYREMVLQKLGLQTLQAMYQSAVIEVNKKVKLEKTDNDLFGYGPYAVLADAIPMGHIGLSEDASIKKWGQTVLDSKPEEFQERFISKETPNNLNCSEFAARVTVLALVLLNNRLAYLLNVPRDQKIIATPFNENEKLHLMHPCLLYQYMQKCGTRINLPTVSQISSSQASYVPSKL